MTIQEAVVEIIKLRGFEIFKNLKQFLAFLSDLAPEYPKELKIIKNNFDNNILGLFIDETKRPNQRLRWVQIKLDDVGVAKDWADFIIESFGLALGWEEEVRDLKVNAPILDNVPKTQSKRSINTNVQDVTLNDDVLKQWGFIDKKSIPDVFNIPSTYKTFSGIIYKIIKIDNEIFKDCSNLKTVTIPDTVTEIGDSAFENCKSLERINIPDSITKIGSRAFANCKSLNNIEIPNSVTQIGSKAFGACISRINAVIPNNITKIEEGLFANCKSLVSVVISSGVTEIGNLAFVGCESLSGVLIPNT
ncbi:leucine-rich repeat domain-containing protein, partial [bacterium]|nr:leucine-rich repeat domain-containing protein [bacterium]